MQTSVFSSKNCQVLVLIFTFLAISDRRVAARKCICTSKACKEAGVEICRTRFSCYTEEIYDIGGTSRDNSLTRGCTEGATPLLCESNAWTKSSRRGAKIANSGGMTNELRAFGERKPKQQLVWPSLKCCDTHDYCNAVVTDRGIVNDREAKESLVKSSESKEIEGEKSLSDEGGIESIYEASSRRKDRYDNEPIGSATTSAGGSTMQDRGTGSTRAIVAGFEDRERSYDPLRHRIGPLHIAVVVLAVSALTSVLGACYVITSYCEDGGQSLALYFLLLKMLLHGSFYLDALNGFYEVLSKSLGLKARGRIVIIIIVIIIRTIVKVAEIVVGQQEIQSAGSTNATGSQMEFARKMHESKNKFDQMQDNWATMLHKKKSLRINKTPSPRQTSCSAATYYTDVVNSSLNGNDDEGVSELLL